MIDKLTFRKAGREDVSLILDFIKKLADYEHLLPEVEATEEILSEWIFDRHAAEVVFAEYDGFPVGFALYFYNFSTFTGRAGLYLEDLFVMPEFRGRGIGKGLLFHLASKAYEGGCGRMEWVCLDWNRSSIDFYKSIGAISMDDWTIYRLSRSRLNEIHEELNKQALLPRRSTT